jgi:4-hydroxy-2-oxoheptanedioate aldolase
MRHSKVMAKLRAGKPVKVAQMGFFVPPMVAYAAQLGYDGIWLDLEHRPMDAREIQALLVHFHLYDIDCILRPPTREKAQLYRYLEDGTAGLIIPHVNDAESARDLVQKVKFPPLGDRGIEGNSLETNFGLDIAGNRERIADHALRETFLIIQIETPGALAQVEQISAVPGLDGLFLGPADLGLRMRHVPEPERVTQEAAMQRLAEVCRAHGLAWGSMPRHLDDVRLQAQLGGQLQIWGHDLRILKGGLTQASRELSDIVGE